MWGSGSVPLEWSTPGVRGEAPPPVKLKASEQYCALDLTFCCFTRVAFSALTLIGGGKGIRPVGLKMMSGGVLAWLSIWSEVQICI